MQTQAQSIAAIICQSTPLVLLFENLVKLILWYTDSIVLDTDIEKTFILVVCWHYVDLAVVDDIFEGILDQVAQDLVQSSFVSTQNWLALDNVSLKEMIYLIVVPA